MLRIAALCREYRVNAAVDLPPEPFQEAMALQSRIDALKTQHRVELTERGRRGIANAREAASLRRAARFERVRRAVMARGGPRAIVKSALARELGIGATTLRTYLKIIEQQIAAGGHVCLACHQRVEPPGLPTVADDDALHGPPHPTKQQ